MSEHANLTTAEGLEALEAELAELEGEGRREIAERIKTAREWGDLKENSEYHDAKNDQAHLETKIARLREKIADAVIVEEAPGGGVVGFGSTVVVRDAEGAEQTWRIVSSRDAAPAAGPLSAESPVAVALLGRAPAIRSRSRCRAASARSRSSAWPEPSAGRHIRGARHRERIFRGPRPVRRRPAFSARAVASSAGGVDQLQQDPASTPSELRAATSAASALRRGEAITVASTARSCSSRALPRASRPGGEPVKPSRVRSSPPALTAAVATPRTVAVGPGGRAAASRPRSEGPSPVCATRAWRLCAACRARPPVAPTTLLVDPPQAGLHERHVVAGRQLPRGYAGAKHEQVIDPRRLARIPGASGAPSVRARRRGAGAARRPPGGLAARPGDA